MTLDQRLRLALSLLVAAIVTSTLFYNAVEGWGLINSFYFSISTATTVGLGDFVPSTHTSRLFASIYMLVSTGLVLYCIALITQKKFLFHLHKHHEKYHKK